MERLCQEKYHSWEWTFGKTPYFSFEREGVFREKKLRISYQVRKGRIEEFSLHSPVFSEQEAKEAFQGQAFSLELFEEKLEDLVQNISAKDRKEDIERDWKVLLSLCL